MAIDGTGADMPELSRLLLEPNRSLNLRLPTVYSFLPYLLNDPLSTVPAFVYGQGKTDGTFRVINHERKAVNVDCVN